MPGLIEPENGSAPGPPLGVHSMVGGVACSDSAATAAKSRLRRQVLIFMLSVVWSYRLNRLVNARLAALGLMTPGAASGHGQPSPVKEGSHESSTPKVIWNPATWPKSRGKREPAAAINFRKGMHASANLRREVLPCRHKSVIPPHPTG